MKEREIRYYESFTDDFDISADQDFKLPDDYKWIRTDAWSKILSSIIYAIAVIVGWIYCRVVLCMHIHGRKKFKEAKGGIFIYGNHTQPFGDVFIPALCACPNRIYTIVSTANYGIPVIGKILPYLGALPTIGSFHGIRELDRAIKTRISEGHPVVIYPEAHVWQYYTEIRPFSDASFGFPARLGSYAYSMTTVYKKSKFHKRPSTHIYIDGPFLPCDGTPKEKAADLCDKVRKAMVSRSAESDIEYVKYVKK